MTVEQALARRFAPEMPELGKALSHAARLAILASAEERARRFSELMEVTGLTTGALSPHLKQLQKGGLLSRVAQMRGNDVQEVYRITSFGRRVLAALDFAFDSHARQYADVVGTTTAGRDYHLDGSRTEGAVAATSGVMVGA